MAAIVPYEFEGQPLRVIDRGGDLWFVATDAAAMLEHAEAKDLTRSLDADEKGRHSVPTPGGEQEMLVISEPGLYRVIVQRRTTKAISPEVKARIARFQRWVFHDVLPSIRRTGRYASGSAQIEAPSPASVSASFAAYYEIGKLIGFDQNQSALGANRATIATTGISPLALMGATHLLAPQQQPLLTPTDLGVELGGISGIAVNNRLAQRGLQFGKRDSKDRAYWVPTPIGEPYARFLDTGKRHGDGTPVRQLKWVASVLDLLRDDPKEAAAPS